MCIYIYIYIYTHKKILNETKTLATIYNIFIFFNLKQQKYLLSHRGVCSGANTKQQSTINEQQTTNTKHESTKNKHVLSYF